MFKKYSAEPQMNIQEKVQENTENVDETPSPAFEKARKALNSCLSIDAVNAVVSQIEKSIRLTNKEKTTLLNLSAMKTKDISEDEK
jgi:hypothetical protein